MYFPQNPDPGGQALAKYTVSEPPSRSVFSRRGDVSCLLWSRAAAATVSNAQEAAHGKSGECLLLAKASQLRALRH